MKLQQCVVHGNRLMEDDLVSLAAFSPQLVLMFASLEAMTALDADSLKQAVPGAQWIGCSTAGEISTHGVSDQTMVFTGLKFDAPAFRIVSVPYTGMSDSLDAGQRLAHQLAGPQLKHVLVLGQGADINGSALVDGLANALGPDVVVTGGLAGDGGRFTGARVLGPHGISDQHIVAVGFDGPTWQITHGSFGGWQPFGPVRCVTKADGNVLYELDGDRALDIYKRYLGDHAAQLPSSGLLFPWSVLGEDHSAVGLIRTILGVNEADGSLVLAGDVPQGGYLQLMQASVDALVNAAESAAQTALGSLNPTSDTLALLVSCVGRKLVMGGRAEEEVEAVGHVLGPHATLAGFYSNGEISPLVHTTECKLHNQTMTITLVREGQPESAA